jgi:hypothetical protein
MLDDPRIEEWGRSDEWTTTDWWTLAAFVFVFLAGVMLGAAAILATAKCPIYG